MKQLAVPFIAFIDAGGPRSTYEKVEQIQNAVHAAGAGQLLQDEQMEPELVADVSAISSVLDLKQLAQMRELPDLLEKVNLLLEATAAPWRTLSEDPDAMTHIERLQSAATQVRASIASIKAATGGMADIPQGHELRFEIRPDWPQRKALLTTEQKSDIVDACTSLSMGEFRMQAQYGLSVKELEDLLLDADVEKCPSCRLYTESHALIGENGEVDGHCTNCR